MKPHDENVLVSLAELFCLTDLPYTLELDLHQLNSGFTTHDSVSTTRNKHTVWFYSTFKAFHPARLESQLKAPSWVSLVLVVTRQTPHTIRWVDGSVQKRHNSITHALEFRISCTNPSTCGQSTAFVLDLRCDWDMLWCSRRRNMSSSRQK